MILQVDPRSPVPPYEQIRAQVTALVQQGLLHDGDRLPPIRQLAHDLGLAGGTVGRAYRELESDGIVATRGRHGTIVARLRSQGRDDTVRSRGLSQAAAAFVAEANRLGAGVEQAVGAVRAAFTIEPNRSRP